MVEIDASNVIQAGGDVLDKADKDLVSLLNNMQGGNATQSLGSDVHVGSTSGKTASSVADIAQRNQEISNVISAASQCVSTGKQNDQKVTGAQTR